MTEIAVRAEDLGKNYLLGQMNSYRTIREAIAGVPARLRHREPAEGTGRQSMWALRHLDFQVAQGEAVGIIGHNGAGKSTLLKLLSRVTGPTEGRAEVVGRVSALLEVGTGFHPELTGRENVYLNGSVLGMRRSEITAKFDDIVAFADVAPHIDTPIKRYSSGMQVRLAFAVAAHLEPEVLIVDEVLAVGDAAFQRKCLGSLERSAKRGRTVLFVSHNLPAIRSLCSRAIVLDRGRKAFEGTADAAVEYYLNSRANDVAQAGSVAELTRHRDYFMGGHLRFTDFSFVGSEGTDKVVRVGDPLDMRFSFRLDMPLGDILVRLNIYSLDDVMVAQGGTTNQYPPIPHLDAGTYELSACIDSLALQPGRYAVGLSARDGHDIQDVIHPVGYFDVVESVEVAHIFTSPGGYLRLPIGWGQPERSEPSTSTQAVAGQGE
jgi:lipopolysaccharide transport system ATP-binding protein